MRTLKGYLTALVVAVIAPGLLFGAATAWWIAGELRSDLENDAHRVAEGIAADVAEYVRMLTTSMNVLARSPSIAAGDYAVAYKFATDLARDLEQHIGLAQPDGMQIFNTRRPYGAEIPRRSDATSYTQALRTGRPSVSDIVTGAIAQAPLITVDVPVAGPSGPLVLGTSTDVALLAAIVRRTKIQEGWRTALVDRRGRFVVHGTDQNAYAGKTAVPEIVDAVASGALATVHHHSLEHRGVEGTDLTTVMHPVGGTSWTVLVSVPQAVTASHLRVPVGLLVAGWVSAVGLGVMFAAFGRRRIHEAVQALKDGAVALGRGGDVGDAEASLTDFDLVLGAMREASALIRDNEGRLRNLAQALAESEGLLRLFTEIVPTGIAMYDRDMRYLAASRRFAEDLRVPLDSLIGRVHYEVFPDTPERMREVHRLCLAGGTASGAEDPFPRADGTIDWVSWEIRPWYESDGRVGGIVQASEVVTRRKLAEDDLRIAKAEAERARALAEEAKHSADLANRSKSEFLASMSHELRTPLNAIIGFADAMRMNVYGAPIHEKYAEYVGDIFASGQHLLSLINEILDLSAIEAGKLTLQEETFDLGAALESSVRLVLPRAERHGVAVIKEVPQLPPLFADQRRVKQIVLNLLSNAVKFTPEGGRVTLSARLDASGAMVIAVADTGIGMDEQGITTALLPFGQIRSELRRSHEGTGLGLPLSRSLTELHGGSLGITSRLQEGTTVTVRFPSARVRPATAYA